jgi:hypothetical protein
MGDVTPWWLPTVLVGASLLFAAAVAIAWLLLLRYRRKFGRQIPPATTGAQRVSWQVGRWDDDPRHAYIANVGDDTAYEVSVSAHDRVVATARSVPSYSADRLSPSSESPCYLNFSVVPQPDSDHLEVTVRWMSANGERFTRDVR